MVVINGIGGNFNVISVADRYSNALIMAAWGEKTNLYEITLSSSTAHVTHLMTLPMVLPVAFDLLGTHFFYVVGHGPTELWVAKIDSAGLVQAHRLIANPESSDVAW
jgi:hypothetical protein